MKTNEQTSFETYKFSPFSQTAFFKELKQFQNYNHALWRHTHTRFKTNIRQIVNPSASL